MTEKPPVLGHKQIQKWVEAQDPNEIICLGVSEIERRAQRDADVAYYEPIIKEFSEAIESWQRRLEQARQDTAREIFEEIEAELIAFEGFSQITQHQAAIINKIWWQSLKEKYEHLQD